MKLIDFVYNETVLARVLVKSEDIDKIDELMKAYKKEHKTFKTGNSISDYLTSSIGAINVGFNAKRIYL